MQYDKAATLISVSRRYLVKPSEADASVRALIASIDSVRQGGYDCPNGPREYSEIKRIWPSPPDVLVLSVEEPILKVKIRGLTSVEMTGIRLADMLELPKC
ncbi:MAG TPA: hypothetical protein VGO46_08095 [Gemmatimonadaceae bacterium]|nr:hypothetical protein [Gemmatimonadaceae bacterium]